MSSFIQIDAKQVEADIHNLIALYPELEDDRQLFLDMLEGNTGLYEIAAKAVNLKADADAMADAIKSRISDLTGRKDRFARQAEAMRKIIKSLMDAAGQTKIVLPEATISIAKGREKIIVDDVGALAQGFFKLERIADREAIKAALDAGETIPGARIEPGQPTLTVRTK